MSDNTKVTELKMDTGSGPATIRQEGDRLILSIPNTSGKSVEEIAQMDGHSCHTRCAGLISNAVAFLV